MTEPKNQIEIWLGKLEQESWQLELLVSGFTIFLLINAYQGINEYADSFLFHHEGEGAFIAITALLLHVLSTSTLVLTINLILHLAFRGFWIGAIGLKSVGPNIDYSRLNYTSFFSEKLRLKIVPIDDLILKLDKVCSVFFSFTFLIIFLFLSLFIYLFLLLCFQLTLNFIADISPSWLSIPIEFFSIGVSLVFLFSGVVYMIDSLSLGLLKKSRRLGRYYFPVYNVLSTLTLSYLYRTIYYHLITKFPLKYVRVVLVAYILIITFSPFLAIDDYRYFPDNETALFMHSEYYDDTRKEESFIQKASLPSMNVSEDFLKLFVRYNPSDNQALEKHCPDFVPAKRGRFKHGIKFKDGGMVLSTPNVFESQPEEALNCLAGFYTVRIDKKPVEINDTYFYIHPNQGEKGIIMLINTGNLGTGLHTVNMSKPVFEDSLSTTEEFANIQFWKR